MLVVANKQDQPHSLAVEEIKEIFNPLASRLSSRESNVLGASALQGYALGVCGSARVWHAITTRLVVLTHILTPSHTL